MKSWLQPLRGALLALGVLAFAAMGAQAQFGTVAVGTSASQRITATVSSAAAAASAVVVTQGAASLDFQASSPAACGGPSCSVSVTFSPKYPGLRTGAILVFDGTNNLIGTTYLSGIGQGGLGVLIPGTINTFAGDGYWQTPGDGGPATTANLLLPSSVALDGVGNLYIADSQHHRIRMVCSGTSVVISGTSCTANTIYTIAGDGTPHFSGDGGAASSAELNNPSGIAVDGAGNLYIADTANNRIREIVAQTGQIVTIAGNGTKGYSGDGSALSIELSVPTGVAVDSLGNVYIADTGNNRIRALCASSSAIFGNACTQGNIITLAGDGTTATLNAPYTLTLDSGGDLYITDTGNNRIRALCASGITSLLGTTCNSLGALTTVVGNGAVGYSGDSSSPGAAISAEFNSPSGVVADPAGNLYVADSQNMRVRKIGINGSVRSIAGNGSSVFGGDTGPSTSAGLYGPYGLAIDPNGNLYIAEYLDNRIREVLANQSFVDTDAIVSSVRQGETSPTTAATEVTVENDGTASSNLALPSIQLGPNTATDPNVTTCSTSTVLTQDATCLIGAVFAPPASPPLTTNQTSTNAISVHDTTVAGVTGANSPLDINVKGTASPVNSTTTTLTSNKLAAGSLTNSYSNYLDPVIFTATVTTGGSTGSLTGKVTFQDGTTPLGTPVALNASNAATLTISTLSVGSHSITATYNADGSDTAHFSSTSNTITHAVSEPTATTLTSSSLRPGLNSSVTLTATVTTPVGGGVTPDGTVTFYNGTNALGPAVAINTAGIATFTTSSLPDGVNALKAVFSGDPITFILGSTSSVLNVDVLASSTIALTSSPNPSIFGSPVTFTATVTSGASLAPTGTVTFLDNGRSIGTAPLVGTSGVATFTTSSLVVGSHPITASYSGDTNSGSVTSTVDIQVVNLSATNTSIVAAPNPGIAGRTVTLTAKVSETAGTGAISGTVTFTDGATSLGTATVNASGVATITPLLGPGAHALVATYNGDSNNAGSASSPLAFSVILATTSTTIASSGSPSYVLAPITLTASVTGNGGTPTGSVTFYFDGASIGSATLNGSAVATFTYTPQVVGTHNLTATYTGDTNDNPSSSGPLAQVIQPIPTTTSLGETTAGGPPPQAILVATVIGPAGPIPTGTVTFFNGANVVGQATIDSTGVATLVPDLPKGTYSITASYSGDAIHAPSTSAAFTYTSTPIDFNVLVAPSTVSVATKQNVTVTLTISSIEGYSDSIGVGCLSLPAAVNCHFSSDTVNLIAGSTQTVQLTIDTNNPLGGGSSAKNTAPGKKNLVLAGLFFPVSLLFGLVLWRFRKAHSLALFGAVVFFLASAFFVTGCGAFSQASATPGTYTIQVGGVGKNSNVSHYQNVTLTITK